MNICGEFCQYWVHRQPQKITQDERYDQMTVNGVAETTQTPVATGAYT